MHEKGVVFDRLAKVGVTAASAGFDIRANPLREGHARPGKPGTDKAQ
jgi:hypothetical protein